MKKIKHIKNSIKEKNLHLWQYFKKNKDKFLTHFEKLVINKTKNNIRLFLNFGSFNKLPII